MLTEQDLKDTDQSLKIIHHIQEGSGLGVYQVLTGKTLGEFLKLAGFILINAKYIFYTPTGKPKNVIQLILSLGILISFISSIVRMVNTTVKQPPLSNYKLLSNHGN